MPMVRAEDCPPEVTKYLNRLSDFLYTAARFAAMRTGEEETRIANLTDWSNPSTLRGGVAEESARTVRKRATATFAAMRDNEINRRF